MATSAIRATLTELRDQLAGAGVPATLDPATVQLPGAWITPRWISPLTLDGGGLLITHVYLIAGDVGTLQAFDLLGGLLAKALTVVDATTENGDYIDTASSIVLPSGTSPMPAFRIVTQLAYPGES